MSKLWFHAGAAVVLTFALSSTYVAADDHGHGGHDRDDYVEHGHGHGDHDDHGRGHRDYEEHAHGNGHAYGHEQHFQHARYDDHDREQMRGWYREHYRNIPPGWAKHDHFPPGWERRVVVQQVMPADLRPEMHPCPPELVAVLPPPPPNYAHFYIGGNVVLVNRANFQVADVFHLDVNIH